MTKHQDYFNKSHYRPRQRKRIDQPIVKKEIKKKKRIDQPI